jgi:hypothetical protein
MSETRIWGQCFLCQKDSGLLATTDSQGKQAYLCRYCGGNNSPARVERGLDNAWRKMARGGENVAPVERCGDTLDDSGNVRCWLSAGHDGAHSDGPRRWS